MTYEDDQIMASIIDDMTHEIRVMLTLEDLPNHRDTYLKMSIVGHNFVKLFERFEHLRIKDRLKDAKPSS